MTISTLVVAVIVATREVPAAGVSTLVVVVVVATREVTAADVTVIDLFCFSSAQQHTLPYSAAIQLSDGNAELRKEHNCLPTHVRGC